MNPSFFKPASQATHKIAERMIEGTLPPVMLHKALVKMIVSDVPGTDGSQAWNALSAVIQKLLRCPAWRNCFSIPGVHGRGSRRQLEYHSEVCDACGRRIECLTIKPVWMEGT